MTLRGPILLVAVGTHGDVLPFASLGRELVSRACAVTLLSNLDHRVLAVRNGLDFTAIAPPQLPHDAPDAARAFHEEVMPAFEASYAAIVERARSGLRLSVVAHDLAVGALSAAEKLSAPCVRIVLAPCGLAATRDRPAPGRGERFDERRAIDSFRRKRGLPPLPTDSDAMPANLIVALFSPHFAAPRVSCASFLLAGFPGVAGEELDPALDAFLRRGAPPVVFTPGTGVTAVSRFFAAAREVCARRSLCGVLLSRSLPEHDETCDADIIARPFVPLDRLLPRARPIVHHGGIGTTAQALRAGVPQVIVPARFDQPDNARRVAELGLGIVVPPEVFGPDVLDAAIGAALSDPTMPDALESMAARLAGEDGLAAAADAIVATLAASAREFAL